MPFERADAEALPFEPATFDAVLNGFGMCHLAYPDLALREAFRVLLPGGRVSSPYGTCPNAPWVSAPYTPLSERTARWTSTFRWDRTSFSFSDPEQSRKALLDAGFVSPSCQQVPQIWRLSDADQLFEIVTEGPFVPPQRSVHRAQCERCDSRCGARERHGLQARRPFRGSDARGSRLSGQGMTGKHNHSCGAWCRWSGLRLPRQTGSSTDATIYKRANGCGHSSNSRR